MGVATRHLRRAAPVVASGAVVLTLVACLVIAKANNVYTGGLTWPYFSDLGRDSPGYDVFCVGLTVVAIALCATWYFNYKFQSSALRLPTLLGYVSPFVQWTARACTVTGIISTIGLPTLAFFSTSSYPSLHNNAAYWFFLLETVAIFLNTYVSYKLVESAKVPETTAGEIPVICDFDDIDADTKLRGMRRTFRLCSALFFVAFLLYLPIGLSVVQPFKRLTIDQCLERDLGQVYCHLTMKHDGVFTKLWNYEQDYSATQMRAAAQLGCILTLVGYSISFLTHNVEVLAKDRDRVATSEASGMQTNHAHFCAIPLLMSPERPSEIRESTDFINV
ncbi:hypothetical protein PF005_g15383 [Phytophthora fragariae]|uniref:CWH43-like N-terminal domain-containing protein n=1 Tax=Phytophthora fragariae TaxID=53985 RepID=A0A6A3XDZ2_9STRA|nr:hypothetical protein PF003_g36993 [Phytophthora fragariae]KAE8933979.1 hypothetical protein PF009_g16030 [Phytophthora fragariae]KAE8999914.1 hypothetical protein PF011_g14419 [Phytophthora fragariae]KAE9099845.1 hypothetical protein PF010_g15038 [Phytophthora fragariae]KAE9101611.1 hypothetical protein PF007_g15075 [Phytophthora fragariae]